MRPSGSRLWLLDHCQYWARDDVVPPPDKTSPAAATGKYYHALIDQSMSGRPAVAEPEADKPKAERLHAAWQRWWPSYAGGRRWVSEAPYVYDWASNTARALPQDWVNGKRERGETEIPAIIDALSLDDVPEVLDHKSGKAVQPAEDNAQLWLGALCVARIFGLDTVKMTIAYPRQRVPFVVDTAVADVLSLEAFAHRLQSNMRSVPIANPAPGDWCWKCNARSVCPRGPGNRPEPDDTFIKIGV